MEKSSLFFTFAAIKKYKDMKTIFIFLGGLIFSLGLHAQSFQGDWNGKLAVGLQKLTLVFHISDQTCTLDSPDQGAKGIPATLESVTSDSISIKISALRASYQGKKTATGIEGVFTQGGMKFPLNLKAGDGAKNRPQTPKAPFDYTTKEVSFTNASDGAVLSGTLVLPKDYHSKTPVILMVSGSGLQNRDEEIMEHKPFLVIADYLAKLGIASLRYDDRSFGKSTGSVVQATTETFKQDAEAGLNYLRQNEHFGKIGILGHSEGGTIAYLLAAAGKADFVVSLAGPTVSGKEILLEQNSLLLKAEGLPEQVVNDYVKVLGPVFDLRIQKFNTNKPDEVIKELVKQYQVSLPSGLQKNLEAVLAPNVWNDYFLALSAQNEVRAMTCPAFLLGGSKDLQVPAILNLYGLKLKNRKSKIKVYPALNHLFQTCQTGAVSEYGEIEETISPEVLYDISKFIKSIK